MAKYNTIDFDPAAPVAYVTLRNEATNAEWLDVPMQIDLGADVTLIPKTTVDKLGLAIISDIRYELMGFDGTVSFAQAVELTLLCCRRTFRGRYLLVEQNMGILGRDILNLMPLVFDGPRLEWFEYRRR
ncbi:hypothetical protein QUF58_02425 [Anaerolineales bacterium HSG24]|nr:hypothetical protein [Anaerolineales bacterium HSG24]